MQNFVQPGNTITLTAPYDVVSGGGALVGSFFGVANGTYASGAEGEFDIVGVFDLPKNAATISQGEKVYWNDTSKEVDDQDSGGSYLIGVATEAAGSSDATVRVRLNGISVT